MSLIVTPSQLATLLSKTIPAKLPVLITGAPGVGKSDIVAQAALAAGADLIISHPVVSDPTDYKGLPFAANGKADFLPFGELRKAIDAKKPTVFFLDDLGQAPPAVQAAAMQLILARRVNGHEVSKHVCFVAATNRRQDRAGVQGILEPVKSRFATIVELAPNVDDWSKWALANGLPTELIAFIRFRPNFLHDFKASPEMKNSPCPRTVTNVGKLQAIGLPSELEYAAYSGAAGEEFAVEYMGFLKIFRTLPNPDVILAHPDKGDVPNDPATLYALCGALARKANDNNMGRVVQYANRLPGEFSVLLIQHNILNINPDLANTRAYIEWASDHGDTLI